MRHALICGAAALLTAGCAHAQQASAPATDPSAALTRFAADYANDAYNDRPVTFGVQIGGESWWTVSVAPGEAGRVAEGRPSAPTFYFTFDNAALLGQIDAGDTNALTSMVAARASDHVPMDFNAMDGYQPDVGWLVPFVFHFWTRGEPETILFNAGSSRVAHGAQVNVLYYLPGYLRSAVVELRPGQHANEEPGEDQEDPFPNMIIMMRGSSMARIGGREVELTEGQAVYIRPNVPHEFWNTGDESSWFIWLAFGDGA